MAVSTQIPAASWIEIGRLSRDLHCGRMCFADYAEGVSRATDRAYTPRAVAAIHTAWLIDMYSGVNELVQQLRAAGIATALLSNTNEAHWHQVRRLEPLCDLDHIWLSHELGVEKPEAAAFAAVEQGAGVRGGAIVYFDDTAANVVAARARGWHASLIDATQPTVEQMRRALSRLGMLR